MSKLSAVPRSCTCFLIHTVVWITVLMSLLSAFAQNSRSISISAKDKTLKEIFNRIEQSSEYRFFYSDNLQFLGTRKTVECVGWPLTRVLDVLLQGSNLGYKLLDENKVIITPSESSKVTGYVRDQNGPLTGVTVVVEGTLRGTTTDSKGFFSIDIDSIAKAVLTFSYLGYDSVKYPVTAGTKITVEMKSASTDIDEIVIVGYTAVKRKDVTGAISSIKAENLLATPASNIGDMLRGRAAGIQVTSSSGQPGSNPSIIIRGRRSMSDGANAPLYIVDGTPVSEVEFASINANDISSIDILKDAAAQSVYGARAANGVVLVTTQRGERGATHLTFDSYVSMQSLWKNFDFYNASEWYQLRATAVGNDLGLPASSLTPAEVLEDEVMEKAFAAGKWTDWEKLMFGNALTHRHELNIRSGTEKMRVAAGIGYLDQDGLLKQGSGFQRLSARLNVDYDFFKWLSMGVNAVYSKSRTRRQEGNFYEYITRQPLGMPYDDHGELQPYINSSLYINPLYRARHYSAQQLSDISRITAFFDVKPFKDFTYRLNLSYSNNTTESGSFKDSKYPGGGSSAVLGNTIQQYNLVENIINYSVPIGNKAHRLHLTGVLGYDRTLYKELSISADDIPVDKDWNMIADGTITGKTRAYQEVVLLSYMARAQYTLKDRYIFTASVRRDGSSKFGSNNKWGTFPAISGAWILSAEPFMKNVKALDHLKIRLSYGQVGNQNGINPYTTLGLAVSYPVEFGDNLVIGYLPGSELPNPNLKWETTTSTNIGLDFGLFKNRLSGSVEFYFTRTNDLLVNRSINSSLGYKTMLDNLGKTKTNGIDIGLSVDLIRKKDIDWQLNFNVSYNKNEIVRVNDLKDPSGRPANDIANNWFVGYPINVYYDYAFDGIYQYSDFDYVDGKWNLKPTIDSDNDGIPDKALERTDALAPGMIKLKDLNADGKIDDQDRHVINRDPKMLYSLSTSFRYRNFDLYMDFYAVTGATIRNMALYDFNYGGTLQGKLNGVKVNYWTPDNPSNEYPAPSFSSSPTYISALSYQDASYLRMKTLTVGYTFPINFTKKMNIAKLRVYATATNLFTLTKLLSYSPETSPNVYPEARQWLFGVNFNF